MGYTFPAFSGIRKGVPVSAATLVPRLMSRQVAVNNGGGSGDATPDQLAAALAAPYLTWAGNNPLRITDGRLTVDLTLFSNLDGAALLHLPNLWLALGKVTDLPRSIKENP